MFCAYCGAQIPEDSVFCEKCGRKQPTPDTSEAAPAAGPVSDQKPAPGPARERPEHRTERPSRTPGNPATGAAVCAALLLLGGIAGGCRITSSAGGWRLKAACVVIYAAGILLSIALLFFLAKKDRLRELSTPGYVLLGAAHAAGIFLLSLLFSVIFV